MKFFNCGDFKGSHKILSSSIFESKIELLSIQEAADQANAKRDEALKEAKNIFQSIKSCCSSCTVCASCESADWLKKWS